LNEPGLRDLGEKPEVAISDAEEEKGVKPWKEVVHAKPTGIKKK